MQLTKYTDFGLRVLMYLTQSNLREDAVTIPEIAERFEVSRNHLVKVVHFLAKQGYIETTRGKGGGLRLARPPESYRLGDAVYVLENQHALVNCLEPVCALQGMCLLSGVLADSLALFYERLNAYTLADVVKAPTGEAIIRLYRTI
jgi:Rrf2 family nitric oxide-sensitive transcriptional repressor